MFGKCRFLKANAMPGKCKHLSMPLPIPSQNEWIIERDGGEGYGNKCSVYGQLTHPYNNTYCSTQAVSQTHNHFFLCPLSCPVWSIPLCPPSPSPLIPYIHLLPCPTTPWQRDGLKTLPLTHKHTYRTSTKTIKDSNTSAQFCYPGTHTPSSDVYVQTPESC